MTSGGLIPDLILGSEAPQGEFLSAERRNWLPLIIPPLVHRLNNALLVVVGASEISDDANGASEADRAFERLNASLRYLSQFAKEGTSLNGSFELSRLLQALDFLSTPYATDLGVGFELRIPSGHWVLRGQLHQLRQWLTCLVLSLLRQLGERAGRQERSKDSSLGIPELCLSVLPGEGCIDLELASPELGIDHAQLGHLLEGQSTWLAKADVRVGSSQRGLIQIRLPMPEGAPALSASAGAASAVRKPLVLVDTDPEQRELLAEFFAAEDFRVSALAGASGLSAEQLSLGILILDLEALRAQPGIAAALLAHRENLGLVLLLGTPDPGELDRAWAGVPCLSKPPKPTELLRQVRSLF